MKISDASPLNRTGSLACNPEIWSGVLFEFEKWGRVSILGVIAIQNEILPWLRKTAIQAGYVRFCYEKDTVHSTDIIHRIQNSDDSVFTELYRSFRDEFVIWISRKQRINEQDACDVFQNAVVIFYQNVKSGKITHLTSSVKTYLFGIGLNKGREWRRKESKIASEEPSPLLLESMMDSYEAKEKEELEDQIKLMYSALRKIGDPCKSILELYYFQRLTMEEIASLNGYSGSSSVKTQKYKCMARLRKIYLEVMQKAG